METQTPLLFNFQGPENKKKTPVKKPRGCSSAGRAPALQAGGQRFESPHLHQVARENERRTHRR